MAGIVRGVDLDLSDEHRLFRDTVRGFAEGVVAPVAEELDAHGRFPLAELGQAAELGLLGVPSRRPTAAPAATRSPTRSASRSWRASTRRSRSPSPRTRRSARCRSCSSATSGSAREWLPRLASGERLAAFGLTEPEAGSDAGATRTTARAEDGEWVIDGSKMFITNAGTEISGCVTITARTGEDEISNFIVPNGTPGYDIGPPLKKMGWKSSDTRPLAFADCRVPSDNLLGPRGEGLHQFLTILDGGRISVAALGLGLAQGAYELALAYARTRQQFGRAISRFQAIQFKLADMATEIAAARALTYRAAWLKDRGRPFAHEASMAKLYTAELACRVADEAVQIHGGYGYMDEYAVSRFYRDAKILEIGEGTNEIQRLVIARGLGLE